jgi:hypothetical protein
MEGWQSKEQGWPGLVESTKRFNIVNDACVIGMSDLVLIQPEGQDWWSGGQVPTRTVEYNGHQFQQIHISRLLQGVGKKYSHYKDQKRADAFLVEFSRSAGIPAHVLIQEITDGPNELRGTWVHERIALHAAAWALVALEVWLYGKLVAIFKGHEMVEAPSQPSAVVMLRVMADALEAQDKKIDAHSAEIEFLTSDVQDIKEEIRKSELTRACERMSLTYGVHIPHPCTWEKPNYLGSGIYGPGLYWIGDPEGDPEKPHYIGETGIYEDRLYRKRNVHPALRFLGATGRRYETRILRGFENTQQRRNVEEALTAAAQPHWKFNSVYKAASKDLEQFKTKAYPLHNYQASIV